MKLNPLELTNKTQHIVNQPISLMDLTSKGASAPLTESPKQLAVWEKYNADVDASIGKIKKMSDQLNQLYEGRLKISFDPSQDTIRDVEINKLTAEIMQEFNACQLFLASIKKQYRPKTQVERTIKQNFLRTKAKKLSDLLEEFRENETQFQSARDKLDEPLTFEKKKPEKEVNIYEISTPDIYVDPLTKRQMKTIQQMNYDFKDHEAVQQLNRDVVSLASMFTDLASLVGEQGETLDRIDYHVDIASEHYEEGNRDLQVAKQIQEKTSKRGLICIIIMIVIAFILSIVIYVQHR